MLKEQESKLSKLMLRTNRNWFSQRLMDGFLVEIYSLKKVTRVKSLNGKVCTQTFLVKDRLERSIKSEFLSEALQSAKMYHLGWVDNLRDIVLDELDSNPDRNIESVAEKVYDKLPARSCFKFSDSMWVVRERTGKEIAKEKHKEDLFFPLSDYVSDIDRIVEVVRVGDERIKFGSASSNLRYYTDGSKVFIGDENDPSHDSCKSGGFARTIYNLEDNGVLLYSLLVNAQRILGIELEFSSRDEETVEAVDKSFLQYNYLQGGVVLYTDSKMRCDGCKELFDPNRVELLCASAECEGIVRGHLRFCYPCYNERFGSVPKLEC